MIKYHTGIFFATSRDLKSVDIEFASYAKIEFVEVLDCFVTVDDPHSKTYELVIHTEGHTKALIVLDLIMSAYSVFEIIKTYSLDDIANSLTDSNLLANVDVQINRPMRFESGDRIIDASVMASKAFGNPHECNAILKYSLCREMCNVHPMDLEPYYEHEFISIPSSQLAFGNIYVLSTSILDELKIQIKASNKNPSYIKNHRNPIVFDDLNNRLQQYGINPNRKIVWIIRENAQRPFRNKVSEKMNACEWSDNDIVSDKWISIIDAIDEIDFIRNQLASHGAGDRTYKLSVHDAENALGLIRVIILSYFGFNDYLDSFNNDRE